MISLYARTHNPSTGNIDKNVCGLVPLQADNWYKTKPSTSIINV